MSETNSCGPNEAAILILRDRERDLQAEHQAHMSRAEGCSLRLDEVRELIATLSRKPRARKARPAEAEVQQPANDTAPVPSIFAPPPPAEDVADAA